MPSVRERERERERVWGWAVQLSGVGEWFIRQQEIVQENSVGIWYSPSSYACRVKVLK